MASDDERVKAGGGSAKSPVEAAVEERARARVGTSLRNKWRLDELLGVGGMAAVYGATHRNGTRAAVKVLHVELSTSADARSRFTREGYLANVVAHDGVVRVLDDDVSDDGAIFLVTELLSGETLEQRRVRVGGRLPEDEVLAAMDQVLDVLAAAHAKGVVHRDIKPENLFLTRSGQIKVLDFGIARMRELSTASQATRFGESMGTPAFMPPEQARGRWDEVDATSDLWACGATMFTLLTGELVNDGPTVNEALLVAMTRPAPPMASIAPDVSPHVAAVADRALAFDKAHRWADARAMQEGVQSAYTRRHQAPITTAPKLVPPEAPMPLATGTTGMATAEPVARTGDGAPPGLPGRHRIAIAGVAAVLVVGALVLALVPRSSTPRALPESAGSPSAAATTQSVADVPPTAASASEERVVLAPEPVASAAPASSPEARARRPAPSSASTATSKTNAAPCTPPFTIDPTTGKKRWKAECL
jgi:serine/threonine-protein kinase